jgi:hypothetical protein
VLVGVLAWALACGGVLGLMLPTRCVGDGAADPSVVNADDA